MRPFAILLSTLVTASLAAYGDGHPPRTEGKWGPKFLGSVWSSETRTLPPDIFTQVTPSDGGKWRRIEAVRGTRDWSGFESMVVHAKKHKMLLKHHTFVWGMGQPAWAENAPDMEKALDDMMDDFFKRFAKDVDMVDVVNEPRTRPPGCREQLGGAGETGWDWVLHVFRRARHFGDKHGYKGKFILNESRIEGDAAKRADVCEIARLLKAENLIDAIGVQGRFLEEMPVEKVKEALDELAATGVPLLVSGLEVGLADDQAQLAKFSGLFRMYWEHPAVKGVTLGWAGEDKTWSSRQDAFLVRKDGTDRPAMKWLRDYLAERRSASGGEPADEILLFAFFRDDGKAGAYLAWSEDGLNFQPLNDDKPVLLPVGGRSLNIVRDPSILYHGGRFRAVWTSPGRRGRLFAYAESPDLVHWSQPVLVQPFPEHLPAEDQPRNIWAPEIHWDPVQGNYAILFTATTPREFHDGDGSNTTGRYPRDHRIYITRTSDWSTFSPAELFFDQDFSVIDAHMAQDGDRWAMVIKNELEIHMGGKNLRLTFAPLDLSRPWTPVTEPIFGPGSDLRSTEMVEGACLIRWNGLWHIYCDAFNSRHYSMATSPDLVNWTDRTDELVMPPKVPRHGSVFRAPRSAVGFLKPGFGK